MCNKMPANSSTTISSYKEVMGDVISVFKETKKKGWSTKTALFVAVGKGKSAKPLWTKPILNEYRRHAEQIFIDDFLERRLKLKSGEKKQIREMLAQQGSKLVIISNNSPCRNCCEEIIRSLRLPYPDLKIYIHFMKLYRICGKYEKDQKAYVDGLRMLDSQINMELDIMSQGEYHALISGGEKFLYGLIVKQPVDEDHREKLRDIQNS